MTDDEKREMRRCTEALLQVLDMCSIPKKAEGYLRQIYARQKLMYDPTPEPSPLFKLSVAEAIEKGIH